MTEPELLRVPPPRTSAPLSVRQFRLDPATAVVEFTGEIDLTNESRMFHALAQSASEVGVDLLVCDLSRVGFMSCGALTVLLRVHAVLTARGALLRVVADTPIIVRMFEVTRLAVPLGLHETIEAALARPPAG